MSQKKNDDVLVRIAEIEGSACVLRGDDIDTDRIIPARFMKVVTFDDMGDTPSRTPARPRRATTRSTTSAIRAPRS